MVNTDMHKVGAKKHYIWQAGNRKEKLSNLIKQKGSEKKQKKQKQHKILARKDSKTTNLSNIIFLNHVLTFKYLHLFIIYLV